MDLMTKIAELVNGYSEESSDFEKVAAVDELMGYGYDFDTACDLVKRAGVVSNTAKLMAKGKTALHPEGMLNGMSGSFGQKRNVINRLVNTGKSVGDLGVQNVPGKGRALHHVGPSENFNSSYRGIGKNIMNNPSNLKNSGRLNELNER